MKVNITFSTASVRAEIFDTPTGRAIYDTLPIKRNVNTWGDEIYFEFRSKEDANLDKHFEGHFRRYVDTDQFAKAL